MSKKVPVSIPLRKRFGLVPGSDRTEADRKFRENWDSAFSDFGPITTITAAYPGPYTGGIERKVSQ